MYKKRYVLFMDEEQVRQLVDLVQTRLGVAVSMGDQEQMILLSGLLYQLKNPREMREKSKSIFRLVREQVLGK